MTVTYLSVLPHTPHTYMTHKFVKYLTHIEIPAKKWGDTEIAKRGRSVLVMRARYRSAGLTPHQRGWKDAGWTVSRLRLCNGPLQMQMLLHDSSRKRTLYSTPCIPPTSLNYARGKHGLYGAWVMLSVKITDPLSGRRAGS